MSPKAAIHFDSGLKVFRTQIASVWPCGQCQRPADTHGVAEFKGCVPDVLFGDEILRECPTLEVTSQYQFGFDLPLLLGSGFGVQTSQVTFAIIIDDFEQALVGPIDVFEFHVDHRIDPMLAWENSEPILPSIPGKERAVACG